MTCVRGELAPPRRVALVPVTAQGGQEGRSSSSLGWMLWLVFRSENNAPGRGASRRWELEEGMEQRRKSHHKDALQAVNPVVHFQPSKASISSPRQPRIALGARVTHQSHASRRLSWQIKYDLH